MVVGCDTKEKKITHKHVNPKFLKIPQCNQ